MWWWDAGAEVQSANLQPILYKRLRIQGSTLRSRSVEYQAELIQRFEVRCRCYVAQWLRSFCLDSSSWLSARLLVVYDANTSRFAKECLGDITGEKGEGKLKTYIHKVRLPPSCLKYIFSPFTCFELCTIALPYFACSSHSSVSFPCSCPSLLALSVRTHPGTPVGVCPYPTIPVCFRALVSAPVPITFHNPQSPHSY